MNCSHRTNIGKSHFLQISVGCFFIRIVIVISKQYTYEYSPENIVLRACYACLLSFFFILYPAFSLLLDSKSHYTIHLSVQGGITKRFI